MFCPSCGHKVEGDHGFCPECGASLKGAVGVRKTSSSSLPKILGIAGAVVAVIVIVSLLLGGIGATITPEQTVKAYYRELERLNVTGMVDLFYLEEQYGQNREMVEASFEYMFAMIDSFSISNLTVTITSQTEDTAEVTAEGSYTYRLKDGTAYSEEHDVSNFALVRVGDKWLISDSDFF